ncbi:DsbA family protein [Pseudobacteriovorax antillogorgiicola]|uniref:Protein-disulfide isomerase n=1 Tax=Pseudobacteriovorax antillogorgiicola TaxID=1513793 RepID=A0A1Y6B288_9BACT|nr:DsbA family protein [Pseudobacteriovorax antillogorgiicola]TCS59509.1 protein-disulfide isomerase [Pseudobacteriovorax antillogorgiicola]SME87886.1 Protein-disulfide isomerase [Pseudobacteriovorax antillogorgiicola]
MAISLAKSILLCASMAIVSAPAIAETAFKINGKSVSVKELYKDNQDKFYELEKQKFELIERLAQQKYLDAYWEELAKKKGVSSEQAQKDYLDSKTKVTESDIKSTLGKFKDHPQLKELSDAEKKRQITDYLQSMKTRTEIEQIVQDAIRTKKLVVSYPKPEEPVYKLTVTSRDPVKYGPKPSDTKPMGCKDDCAITVIEYSEFQCPFCEKVLPTVRQLMTEYKGKVRWIVRDFPLGFHKRARPAAMAAHCAKDQNKYWEMYEELFKNQRKLEDDDLKKYAKNIGLDMGKFEKCYSSQEKMADVEANYRMGEELGVTGTPAFFVNGRRLSGALPYREFKRIFEEELAKKGRS